MLLKSIFKLFLNCICLGSRALLLQEYVLCVFFLMGTGLRHRRLLGITFPVSPFTMHHYLNLAVTLNTTWLQSLPHVPLFYFYFFLRPNGSIFRYLASLESGMICEKFLQFMTATCSLGHRLITPDQAWKHAGAICCSPYWGASQCCLINSTAQHPIQSHIINSVPASSFERTWDLFVQDLGKQHFYVDSFCRSAAKSSVCVVFKKSIYC